jgi:hypothetical protein
MKKPAPMERRGQHIPRLAAARIVSQWLSIARRVPVLQRALHKLGEDVTVPTASSSATGTLSRATPSAVSDSGLPASDRSAFKRGLVNAVAECIAATTGLRTMF